MADRFFSVSVSHCYDCVSMSCGGKRRKNGGWEMKTQKLFLIFYLFTLLPLPFLGCVVWARCPYLLRFISLPRSPHTRPRPSQISCGWLGVVSVRRRVLLPRLRRRRTQRCDAWCCPQQSFAAGDGWYGWCRCGTASSCALRADR